MFRRITPGDVRRAAGRVLIAVILSVLAIGTAGAAPGAVIGRVVTPFPRFGHDVVVDAQDRVIVVGWTLGAQGRALIVTRYAQDQLDDSFGDHGRVVLDLGRDNVATAVVMDSEQRVVIGGYIATDDNYDFLVVRLLPTGELDSSFAERGWTRIGFDSDFDEAFALAIDGEGRIVVGGLSLQGFFSSNEDFALTRLLPDGRIDGSFADEGRTFNGFGHHESVEEILFDQEGRIVAVGGMRETDDDFANIVMARYMPNGALDPTFGEDRGKAIRTFGPHYSFGHAAALDAQGRIVVAGTASPSHVFNPSEPFFNADIALARFNVDGSIDDTFGDNGVVLKDIKGFDDFAEGVAIDATGRILLGGSSYTFSNRADFLVARFDANGVLDPHFGDGGISVTPFIIDGELAARSLAHGMTRDAQGRIVLAGESLSAVRGEAFLAYARFDIDHPDYAVSGAASAAVRVGGATTTPIVVTSIDGFNLPVSLTVAGDQNGGPLPAGVTISFNDTPGNTVEVQVPPYASTSVTMQIAIARTVRPQRLTLWLRPEPDAPHTHQIPIEIVVTARAADIVQVVDLFQAAGAINSAPVASSLKTLAENAQTWADQGNIVVAANRLNTFNSVVESERGRSIASTATIDGVTFNPHATLLADARDAIAGLHAGTAQNPIVGYVTNELNQGVSLAVIAIVDAANQVVATAHTDATGLYRVTTGALTPGARYSARVTAIPPSYSTATPASQSFTWQSVGVVLPTFVVH